jgi:alkaline phosphatase
MITETLEWDKMMAVVKAYAKKHPDTLIVSGA